MQKEPEYMKENRYSYSVGFWKQAVNIDYEIVSPEAAFERRMQDLFLQGQNYMNDEKFALALNTFQELMALILRTADPRIAIDPNQIAYLAFPSDTILIDTLVIKTAEILKKTPLSGNKLPQTLMSEKSIIPQQVVKKIGPALSTGLKASSYHAQVSEHLESAQTAVIGGNLKEAMQYYAAALDNVPDNDVVLHASLSHDMAILAKAAGDLGQAQEHAQKSTQLFLKIHLPEAQVQALDTYSGILHQAGNEKLAIEQAKKAEEIRGTIIDKIPRIYGSIESAKERIHNEDSSKYSFSSKISLATGVRSASDSSFETSVLMGMTYVSPGEVSKSLCIQGTSELTIIEIDNNAESNIKTFLENLRDTNDLQLITNFWLTSTQMMGYIPHMYFFIVPMSMGDCLSEMGCYEDAEEKYSGILSYPYINKNYEVIKLWTRLAQVYLDMGDKAYRNAGDDSNNYSLASDYYKKIVLLDSSINSSSPLYKDSNFANVKDRVEKYLKSPDPVTYNDNPSILLPVLKALTKLQQIKAGLNFFGLPPNSPPPFSFEYMQNTARYFAQQASQIEQRYIQYKNNAENEQFRQDMLDQQYEVAKQTATLETRGLAEAKANIEVAKASYDYASAQYESAVQAVNDFSEKSSELAEYAELEAWAGAASVSNDDEMKLTISGYAYYSSDHKMRSDVIKDLACKRTRVSYDLEANKLNRIKESANAYKKEAQAQEKQSEERKKIAEQRVAIAELQKIQAEQNKNFLKGREFSAHLWRELAVQARLLKKRYLDMAIEIASLMERAYNAETERNVHVIRSNYEATGVNGLMGADYLLLDIDFFTYDNITTVKTRKLPVKQVISLADSFAMAFQDLKANGRCFFQTELADFDRYHPGMYMCKIRNIELIFIGITDALSLSGSLRNIGISRFRREDGSIVIRQYPSDVMVLSQYELRQDALAFRFNPNELRLFENNGIDTLWQLDLPLDANQFDYRAILDIQLVIYYDGFFSPSLEKITRAALPTISTASRGISLSMYFFDELYYLKNKGEAKLVFDSNMFPGNQCDLIRTKVTLKAIGKLKTIRGLKLRLTSANLGENMLLTADTQGVISGEASGGASLKSLLNKPILDQWTLQMTNEDNPEKDLSGLDDVLIFFEYSYKYR